MDLTQSELIQLVALLGALLLVLYNVRGRF